MSELKSAQNKEKRDMIQEKQVTNKEIIELLNKSRVRSHPYYYRFNYSTKEHISIAKRIRKGEIVSARTRHEFHSTDLDESHPMSRALVTLEKNKAKIQGLVYAKQ